MLLGNIEIRRLIENYDLISDYIDLDTQLQPSGFDLTIKTIEEYTSGGAIDFSNKHREIAEGRFMPPQVKKDQPPFWALEPLKSYRINFNEIVNLRDIPYPISVLSGRRGSLMRSGIMSDVGIWDYGYVGKGQSSIFVGNPKGFCVYENARFHQCLFFPVDKISLAYNGVYQGEGITK